MSHPLWYTNRMMKMKNDMKNENDKFAAFGRKVEAVALADGGQDTLDELRHYGGLDGYVREGYEEGWTAEEVVGQAAADV